MESYSYTVMGQSLSYHESSLLKELGRATCLHLAHQTYYLHIEKQV